MAELYFAIGAFFVSAIFGIAFFRSIQRGNFNSGWVKFLAFTSLGIIVLISFHVCAFSGNLCLPGFAQGQPLVIALGTLGLFASMIGVIFLPFSAFLLSSVAFGWIYFIATGRKRIDDRENIPL